MKLRTKLLVAYLQEIEKEGKLGGGMEIMREVLQDLKEMEQSVAAPSPN